MDKHGGVGDGGLHLVHGGDHLRGDDEVLLGLGEGVRQGTDDVSKAGKEPAVKIMKIKYSLITKSLFDIKKIYFTDIIPL